MEGQRTTLDAVWNKAIKEIDAFTGRPLVLFVIYALFIVTSPWMPTTHDIRDLTLYYLVVILTIKIILKVEISRPMVVS